MRTLAGLKKHDPLIIVGGPPCKPFSKAAYWTEEGEDAAYRRARASGVLALKPTAKTSAKKDSRRDLVMEYWRLVQESNADGFVFENLPSIKHPRNKPVYDSIVRHALEAGFNITEVLANASEYGVAQARERVLRKV